MARMDREDPAVHGQRDRELPAQRGQVDLGFCWTWTGGDLDEGLTRLGACGFEGIEIWQDPLREHGAKRWAEALEASGMRCFQLCPYFDLVHGPAAMDRSRAILDELLAAAEQLGCTRLRTFTGPPWGEGMVGARDATLSQWDGAISGLREFCDVAAGAGLELCLECHEGNLAEDGPSTLRLIQAVGRANLTVNLQLPLRDEDWRESLALLGPHTSHIHIHNWTEGLGGGDLTCLVDGTFDWLPVVGHVVAGLGRDVCLSVEHADHGRGDDVWATARRDGPFLVDLRRRLATFATAAGPSRPPTWCGSTGQR